MKSPFFRSIPGALATLALAAAGAVQAQTPIKIGVLVPLSGPQAEYGAQITAGMKVYMKEAGDVVAGRKIQLVTRDSGSPPSPDVAKRLATELVTREKVEVLAGFGFTPDALSVAAIATEAKVPMVVMNAATSVITTRSPYIIRASMTLPQVTAPVAQWALKNGIKKVFSLVSDYGPGIDAEGQFKKTFTAGGGEIIGDARVPLNNPEFAPFTQRIKDSKPDAVFLFLPSGEQPTAFFKSFVERGLAQAGIKLIGTGDATDDTVLNGMGDSAIGLITTHHYSAMHDSAKNKAYVKNYADVNGNAMRPNFMSVGGYDGMAVIYEMIKKGGGKIEGLKSVDAVKGLKLDSPRGPIMIDPDTRDIVQNVYVRRVQKVGNELYNVEFDKFENVKDPGK
jgi:branched-chain amino acid transport system substrate-binding protein